jgi:hypothetical protein
VIGKEQRRSFHYQLTNLSWSTLHNPHLSDLVTVTVGILCLYSRRDIDSCLWLGMEVIGTTQVLTLPHPANLPVAEMPPKPFCTLLAVNHFNTVQKLRNNFYLQRKKFHLVAKLNYMVKPH